MTGKKDINIAETIRQFVQDEIQGIYTISSCIVESVDSGNRRVEVSLKTDKGAIIDNVPIASPFASDGAGLIIPVRQDDEGMLLHSRMPLDGQLQESGHVEVDSSRRYELESAIFLPMVWLDDMEVPAHEDGEFMLSMTEDGSDFVMAPDGSVSIEHQSGKVIEMGADGSVTIGDPSNSSPVLTEDASLTDSSGGSVSIDDPGSNDLEVS